MNVTNLILFLMATVGLTNIMVFGSIFNSLRHHMRKALPAHIYELFECYQCMGTWVGAGCGYVLMTHDAVGVAMCAFAGSFAAHYAALAQEWLEANSVVTITDHEDPEVVVREVVVRDPGGQGPVAHHEAFALGDERAES